MYWSLIYKGEGDAQHPCCFFNTTELPLKSILHWNSEFSNLWPRTREYLKNWGL